MKAYRWRRYTSPPILSLHDGERLNSGPHLFTAGKKPHYPFNTSMGGPHSRLGSFTEKKKKFASNGIRTADRPARRIVKILTELLPLRLYGKQENFLTSPSGEMVLSPTEFGILK
jgi:hypothetical protein